MAVKHIGELDKHLALCKGKPAEKLVKWIDAQYSLFCTFVEAQNRIGKQNYISPDLQISSSYRDPKKYTYSKSHSEYKGVDVARYDISMPQQLRYIALFGFWLQKNNNGLAHVAISVHNKHVHIDMLTERLGQNDQEYKKSDGTLSFQKLNVNEIFDFYDFYLWDKELYRAIENPQEIISNAEKIIKDNIPWWIYLIPLGILYLMFKKK